MVVGRLVDLVSYELVAFGYVLCYYRRNNI